MTRTLGVDFGTSNSAAGIAQDGVPRLITLEDGRATLPTTFFFEFDTRQTLMGEAANQALLTGAHGRFMRALKRVLGTSLMHEKRQILNQRVSFVEVIARFLARIKTRAETETGLRFDRALSGRPVVFHGTGDPREAQAEEDLRQCYLAAGFRHVEFLPEPQAAAVSAKALDTPDQLGLIVDIGGGTSDFSLFRSTAQGGAILANHGVRIGGTDFDRAISIDHVMPMLGKGTMLRRVMADGLTPVPLAIYNSLATWEEIPFQYTAQNRRMVDDMLPLAQDPKKLRRLETLLRDELGHDLAFAVERGKIAANSNAPGAAIDLSELERGLQVALAREMMDASLASFAAELREGVTATLKAAGAAAQDVDRVVYVGGSSLMSIVMATVKQDLPGAEHVVSNVFTAVADGLAIEAARRDAG